MKMPWQIGYKLVKYSASGDKLPGGTIFGNKKDAIWEGLNYLKELSDGCGWSPDEFIEEIDKFIAEFNKYNIVDEILTSYLDIEEVEI